MLCQSLLYSKVDPLHMYIYPFFFGFPCHQVTTEHWSSLSCTTGSHQLPSLYTASTVYIRQSPSPIHPTPFPPLGVNTFILYVCISVSVLQITNCRFKNTNFLSYSPKWIGRALLSLEVPGETVFSCLFCSLLLSHYSRVQLCATPQTEARQAPPSLGFSRQEHWSGLPFPSPMHESEK